MSQLALSAKVLKLVPPFDGSTGFESWWRRFELACMQEKLDTSSWPHILPFCLSPKIFEEIRDLGLEGNLEGARKFLTSKYKSKYSESEAKYLLLRRRQAPHESLHELASDLYKMAVASKSDVSPQLMVRIFINAMASEEVSQKISEKKPSDIWEAVEMGNEYLAGTKSPDDADPSHLTLLALNRREGPYNIQKINSEIEEIKKSLKTLQINHRGAQCFNCGKVRDEPLDTKVKIGKGQGKLSSGGRQTGYR
ncbi:hypothetical protein RF11_04417 [Thelohanellus kitauei]|uniref:Retrotransposon gag domain-containing protein n=1 Tax=Thelohanellus kitauei TaxID=669202 RepID=A0A0C2I6Q3_THEKT|nr:hypothetical protein RF11_04417 [Thelohanellus kitauei]